MATGRADVFDNVGEAVDYELVYTLDIPNAANYGANGVPYSVDHHQSIAGPIDRIAYYMEVTLPGGEIRYVYASMDAFTQDLGLIGIPTASNGAYFQRNVRNMTVISNVPGIVTDADAGITGANIEFWRSNYGTDNIAGVPNADAGSYDSGDNAGGPAGGGTYGSFQIHNHDAPGAPQTLFAYNRWNDGASPSDLGIGNNTQATGDNRVNADWTFRGNAGSYTAKTLQVLVRLGTPTRDAILPLGDSITYGAGGVGGYRDQLFDSLTLADWSFEFIGSAGGNPSLALTAASQVNHEGHSGYRIDHIAYNLAGNDGTGGNNGGFWFNSGVQPDVILLHILKNRLDSLVNQLTLARPNADLLVAGIIPMNVSSGGKFLNEDVKAYNSYIRNTLVPKYRNLGRRVSFVDQYPNFVNANGTIKTALLPDGVHPNQAGYDLMADTWSSAILALP